MYSYKNLENISIDTLHEAFLEGFSDYQVKIDLPLNKFKSMIQRRGYAPDLSMGAFFNNKLVGFILNGYRSWNGKSTVYDTGTAVLPQYRKQGITSSIFQNIKDLLKDKRAEQYLLEVIISNTAAVNLYKKLGFKIIRIFDCFQLDKVSFEPGRSWEVRNVDKMNAEDWKNIINFWDVEPSWQNSIDSINAAEETFYYSIVYAEGKIAGYGIIDRKTGDIPQIAVDKAYRGKGIGTSIVTNLIENTEAQRISALNIDTRFESIKDFLYKAGFKYSIGQYEMILKL